MKTKYFYVCQHSSNHLKLEGSDQIQNLRPQALLLLIEKLCRNLHIQSFSPVWTGEKKMNYLELLSKKSPGQQKLTTEF